MLRLALLLVALCIAPGAAWAQLQDPYNPVHVFVFSDGREVKVPGEFLFEEIQLACRTQTQSAAESANCLEETAHLKEFSEQIVYSIRIARTKFKKDTPLFIHMWEQVLENTAKLTAMARELVVKYPYITVFTSHKAARAS